MTFEKVVPPIFLLTAEDFIKDETQSLEDRIWVWTHYGTAYRATYTLQLGCVHNVLVRPLQGSQAQDKRGSPCYASIRALKVRSHFRRDSEPCRATFWFSSEIISRQYGAVNMLHSLVDSASGCGPRNWPTNARPVLERVSQAFVIFYLLYITIIVFAVIRVISAIFLKDTLDEAHNDAQHLVLDRIRKKAEYVERLEGVFKTLDVTGRGTLSEQVLNHMLANPKVKAYFQTLEVDVQEGTALFHLLDNGDLAI